MSKSVLIPIEVECEEYPLSNQTIADICKNITAGLKDNNDLALLKYLQKSKDNKNPKGRQQFRIVIYPYQVDKEILARQSQAAYAARRRR